MKIQSPDAIADDIPWSAVIPYLAGTATDVERSVVDTWVGGREEREAVMAEWAETIQHTRAHRDTAVDVRWGRFLAVRESASHGQVDMVGQLEPRARRGSVAAQGRTSSGRPILRKTVYGVFSLAIAGVLAVIAFRGGDPRGSHPQLPANTYSTTAGQYAAVTFADGSRAQLGPMTTLTVTGHPADRRVNIQVTGEALFRVIHRSDASFQVHTANAVTRVLGTTFFVRRYPADVVTRVVVADGRVSLSGTRSRTAPILTTRMLGAVDDSGRVVITPNIAVEDYTTWPAGPLVFRDAPIRDIIAELSRAYNVEFRISDSLLADQHLNWTIPLAQKSLSDILAVLSNVLDAHPVQRGHTITFVPGRPASRRLPRLPSSPSELQYGR